MVYTPLFATGMHIWWDASWACCCKVAGRGLQVLPGSKETSNSVPNTKISRNISHLCQLGSLFPIYGKIRFIVPNTSKHKWSLENTWFRHVLILLRSILSSTFLILDLKPSHWFHDMRFRLSGSGGAWQASAGGFWQTMGENAEQILFFCASQIPWKSQMSKTKSVVQNKRDILVSKTWKILKVLWSPTPNFSGHPNEVGIARQMRQRHASGAT